MLFKASVHVFTPSNYQLQKIPALLSQQHLQLSFQG